MRIINQVQAGLWRNLTIIWVNGGNSVSWRKDKSRCQQSDKWLLCCAGARAEADAHGPIRSCVRRNIWNPVILPVFFFSLLSLRPLFHLLPVISASHLPPKSLAINPTLYSEHFLLISLLFILTASQKQGQSCNPFTAPLSTVFTQIILNDSQSVRGGVRGAGQQNKRRTQRRTDRGSGEKGSERRREETDGGNLCHGDLSLCRAGDAQGVPSAWARRQTGARVNLKED